VFSSATKAAGCRIRRAGVMRMGKTSLGAWLLAWAWFAVVTELNTMELTKVGAVLRCLGKK